MTSPQGNVICYWGTAGERKVKKTMSSPGLRKDNQVLKLLIEMVYSSFGFVTRTHQAWTAAFSLAFETGMCILPCHITATSDTDRDEIIPPEIKARRQMP